MQLPNEMTNPIAGSESSNSWPVSERRQTRKVRVVQLDMTDAELAENGLMVNDQPKDYAIFNRILGLNSDWNRSDPILAKASHFGDLTKEPEPRPERATRASWLNRFEVRLASLREAAAEEDITLSEKSVTAVRKFAKSLHQVRPPSTFLLGNGNIRLLWVNDDGEQVGLQFRDNKQVQYIFFRMKEGVLGQIMGTESPSSVLDLIRILGLRHIIAE